MTFLAKKVNNTFSLATGLQIELMKNNFLHKFSILYFLAIYKVIDLKCLLSWWGHVKFWCVLWKEFSKNNERAQNFHNNRTKQNCDVS